ncbi:DUF1223 domain-containing protein [Chelativorans salis]|uniref:DUF1223 domain-containing protein n=1 Tax=Chelativorans salis TaxID=2978478 RepID=A0ABT2LPG8_9HYPH|nr:DUF1223 domain-containing protein [Chelativorans sp. EGI FJ00035]MCT7376451.1 DUF1223 domain-containing protein [Chelativorans sp. EGI FJ00035]
MRTFPARIHVSAMKLTILLLVLIIPFHIQAAERPAGVVELFTSQGCSSCPPADALLAELAERDDVVALAYHVDYWDYLGWKDEMATPENSARQRAYGETFDRSVYTPQVVVNGQRDIVGSHRKEIYAAIDKGSEGNAALPVDVDISSSNGSVFVNVGAAETAPADTHIVVVYYKPRRVVSIRGGENRGRSIEYRNIVTSFQTVGMWHGKAMRLELPKSEMVKKGGHCAVLLQSFDAEGRPGAILGAARTAESW